MITPDSMSKDAKRVTDLYERLERQIFNLIINMLKDNNLGEIDSSNVLQWQQQQLNQLNYVVNEAIKIVSGKNPHIEAELKNLIKENGQQIVSDVDNTLQKQTHKTVPVSEDVTDMIGSYLESAFTSFNKHINSTLLSRNVNDNATGKVYRDIINQATAQTITGLKTHEQAVNGAIYKWIDAGLPSALTNRAGSNMSIDSYARMVVNTSAHQTFNDLRLKRMEDYGTKLALMSSHAASRPACAPIQGRVVNLVPESNPNYDSEYDSIYNHDYGKPGGTQGVNCSHILFPYHKGWNTNNQPQYDPKKAIENGEIQQKQRGYERNVRRYKELLAAAEKLQDVGGIQHYKGLIAGNQKRLRDLVKDNDFLYRDYSREKIYK
ncbi:capsid protein [Pediococcus pentosaceus]|uniref:phage minor capsid protein n=1 Tax=Pediococcus pentosaceus TaxID=1255 RepID=UPI001329C63B|nr:phage minor capsid protein [Pediococcus pentosaceus]KAF0444196.1 capsid protein [Pediococcus pentosaceus]